MGRDWPNHLQLLSKLWYSNNLHTSSLLHLYNYTYVNATIFITVTPVSQDLFQFNFFYYFRLLHKRISGCRNLCTPQFVWELSPFPQWPTHLPPFRECTVQRVLLLESIKWLCSLLFFIFILGWTRLNTQESTGNSQSYVHALGWGRGRALSPDSNDLRAVVALVNIKLHDHWSHASLD